MWFIHNVHGKHVYVMNFHTHSISSDLEKGISDSATPSLAMPSFYNAESAEFLSMPGAAS